MPLISPTDSGAIAADFLDNSARSIANDLNEWSAACDARSVNTHTFLTDFLQRRLIPRRNEWIAARAVSGVAAAIRNRFPGKFADDATVTALLTDINNGMTTLIDWISVNVQASLINAAGYVEVMKFVNNAPSYRLITQAAACDNLKAQLQTLRGLIIG